MKNHLFGLIFLLGLCGCISPNGIPGTPVATLPTIGFETATPKATLLIETPARAEPLSPTIVITPPNFEDVPQILPTPYIGLFYRLQPGTPIVMPNFAHRDSGCNWMGVGGQVFDINGNPAENIIIKLTGTLNGNLVEMISLSGGALYLGPGGYEFKLADQPIESRETLWLTLYDNQGTALSDPTTFSTFNICDQNYLLINFLQMRVVWNGFHSFLPFVDRGRFP